MEGEKSPKFPISTEHPLSIPICGQSLSATSLNKVPLNNRGYELPELHVQRKHDVFLRFSSHMLYVHRVML